MYLSKPSLLIYIHHKIFLFIADVKISLLRKLHLTELEIKFPFILINTYYTGNSFLTKFVVLNLFI